MAEDIKVQPEEIIEEQPKTGLLEKLNVHKFRILVGILGVLIFTGATFGAYKLGQKLIVSVFQQTSTPVTVATPTPTQEEDIGEFAGIGVELEIRDGNLTIVSVLENTPAEEARIEVGDAILKIDGETTKEMSFQEAISKIKGEVGTQVRLTMLKKDGSLKDLTLTRVPIKIVDEKIKSWNRIVERLFGKSIYLELNINNDKLTLLEEKLLDGPGPNYYPGKYPFKVKVFSLEGKLLAEYGFSDPRVILGEMGYEGPIWIDNVNFPLILPYWYNGKNIKIYDSSGRLLLSVDIAKYATSIIEGKVTDQKGNPVPGVYVTAYKDTGDCATDYYNFRCPREGSAYTDNEGRFVLAWLDGGRYILTAKPKSSANLMLSPWKYTDVSVGEIKTLDITLKQCGSITGKITDKEGNPLTEAAVYEIVPGVPHDHLFHYYPCKIPKECELGTFFISNLEPREYTIGAEVKIGEKYIEIPSKEVKVELGQTATVNFVFEK